MYCVLAYDIRSHRRRQRVFQLLKNYGLPVQLSVVECELDSTRLAQLKQALMPLLNLRTDRLRIYPLCETCASRIEAFGHRLVDNSSL